MKSVFRLLGRVAVTCSVVAVAGIVGWSLWNYYMDDPWTRDGRVRADVVGVAADVSGLVTEVAVADNQVVKKGDVLLVIDPARFQLALQQAEAVLASRKASMQEAFREMNRYQSLNNTEVSVEKQQQTQAAAEASAAAYQQAMTERDVAKLNLVRSTVVAPVDGIISNFDLQPGTYVSTGHSVAALLATKTLRVEGYFEETKLPRIHVGDRATVHMMGENQALAGRVDSIAAGVVDRERSGSDLLANINPTFSWVRLAQRIPVRITLDPVPSGVRLVAGRTATVTIGSQGGAGALTADSGAGRHGSWRDLTSRFF